MRMLPLLRRALLIALIAAVGTAFCGCSGHTGSPGNEGIQFTDGTMLHAQQVLERYDANGNAIEQYLELWLTKDSGKCLELDSSGKALSAALDTPKGHIVYDTATNLAQKSDKSLIFTVNFASISKIYPTVKTSNEGQYAGRSCTFYVLDNGKADEWAKLYVDKKTGFVLLCDAPLFRLRTARFEELPADNTLFAAPANLSYKEGADK